jgi:hypothetical protein
MAKSSGKVPALKLTLGGAPNTPHRVGDLPGFFLPDRPTPVGGPDDRISEEQAREADRRRGIPLELVELTQQEADDNRRFMHEYREAARGAIVSSRKSLASDIEASQLSDEARAVAGLEPKGGQ